MKNKYLSDLYPNVDDVLKLEPEFLGGFLISHINELIDDGAQNNFHRSNFIGNDWARHNYPHNHEKLQEAISEAWHWLEREGVFVPKPGDTHGWIFVSRRGRGIKESKDLQRFRNASLLPRQLIHPSIVSKVWASFSIGEYDTAVFQSFKQVEVAVRDRANALPTDIGVDLMRKAFNPHTGPLRDPNLPVAEREAIAALFAGAIGYSKNPHSHRNVNISDPTESVELIVFASHLLRIVDGYPIAP
jgi:uncharacterized protein (TIGR02391 family)